MKSVLILDANQRSALATTRSLGLHQVVVYAADEDVTALAGCSRYCKHYFSTPSPRLDTEAFIHAIIKICQQHGIAIVMPMTELTANLLLTHQSSLPNIILPFADLDTINRLADKCSLMHLAESLNIPIPKTWHANTPSQLPVKLDALNYPLVLKPGMSWLQYKDEWLHTTVRIAKNITQAEQILNNDTAYLAHPFMLQEFIPGSGGGVFAIYDRGKPLAFFAHKRIREKPPSGGVSVLSESSKLDPVLENYARKLLDHVAWHGVAMVEFRLSPDGTPYLMEVNTRFWGSLQLAINAGVDFPWLLYQLSCNENTHAIKSYKTGVRLHWLLGNLDWLYLVLRDSKFTGKQKMSAIFSFLKPSPFKSRCDVFRISDAGPFWWELKRYFKPRKIS